MTWSAWRGRGIMTFGYRLRGVCVCVARGGDLRMRATVDWLLHSRTFRRAYFRAWPWDRAGGASWPALSDQAVGAPWPAPWETAVLKFLGDTKGGVGVFCTGADTKQLGRVAWHWQRQGNRACLVQCTKDMTETGGLTRRIQETMRVPGVAGAYACQPLSSFLPACDPSRQPALFLDEFATVAGDADVRQELKELALDSELSKTFKLLVAVDCGAQYEHLLQTNRGQKFCGIAPAGPYA